MPSESFSVAIAFSFNNHRNLFSSSSNFSTFAAFAFSGLNLRSTESVDFDNSSINSGLIVRQSHPANSRIFRTGIISLILFLVPVVNPTDEGRDELRVCSRRAHCLHQ